MLDVLTTAATTGGSTLDPAVGRGLADAARDDVGVLSDDDLLGRVLELERVSVILDAARAHALAELDARNVCDEHLGLRTGAWVANSTRTPHPKAKRRVGVARRVRDEFPLLDAALVAGRVTWFHCEAVCDAANPRIAAMLAALLPELIDLAETMGFGPWHRELWRVARRLDVDTGYDPDRDETASRLYLNRTLGGVRELTGRLCGALGASFEELLDAETDRQYRLAKQLQDTTSGETEIPSRAELRALALVELCRKGAATYAGTAGPVADITLTHHTNQPSTGYGLTVEGLVGHCGNEYETIYGDLYTARDLGCRLCDPTLRVLHIDGTGARLDLGREERFASRDQRRAAHRRDGGCIFPGCDVPARWCDLHHLIWWEHGGPTDIANLPCLCRYHHGVTHRAGWHMGANGDGTYYWRTPSGRILQSQQHFTPTRHGP